jgi:hypothetical protein
MDDQDMKRDMKHWPFKVQEKNGKPAITVNFKGENRDFVSFVSISSTAVVLNLSLVPRGD